MIVSHEKNIEKVEFDNPEVKGASMKAIISPKEGWEGHVMRVMEVEEEGYTPKHSHPWPHINYMLEGKGILFIDGKEHEVEKGSYAYVPENKLHQFKNVGKGKFKFICIVPEKGHK
ncbi:cupin domain-containing protein [Senegalia massiliensis]|uniref:Cupin domain-containing protein n=1 Tax=Senegalia massiliensis TaxID=1720316 RepID=A0A845QY91_9CLOT|nr:cupin domain-containing protein [Senegalia massiliensis]NBI07445.1 cupin domain-containing protein [Senegalia massiliensis]